MKTLRVKYKMSGEGRKKRKKEEEGVVNYKPSL
jgi:hypothetical protein